jgi:hypothetical protein
LNAFVDSASEGATENHRDGAAVVKVSYTPRQDATQESEAAALAAVYSLVLRAYEDRKKAVPADGPDDAKEIADARATKPSIRT